MGTILDPQKQPILRRSVSSLPEQRKVFLTPGQEQAHPATIHPQGFWGNVRKPLQIWAESLPWSMGISLCPVVIVARQAVDRAGGSQTSVASIRI